MEYNVITFNKNLKNLKSGNIYTLESVYGFKYIFIFKSIEEKNKLYSYVFYECIHKDLNPKIRYMIDIYDIKNIKHTPEKLQFLQNKLELIDLHWNSKNNCIEKFKWEPKEGDTFWHLNYNLNTNTFNVKSDIWIKDTYDVLTFKTEEGCQELCDEFNNSIKNIKNKHKYK